MFVVFPFTFFLNSLNFFHSLVIFFSFPFSFLSFLFIFFSFPFIFFSVPFIFRAFQKGGKQITASKVRGQKRKRKRLPKSQELERKRKRPKRKVRSYKRKRKKKKVSKFMNPNFFDSKSQKFFFSVVQEQYTSWAVRLGLTSMPSEAASWSARWPNDFGRAFRCAQ